ncbi:MAG: tyrosine-type recombinase/integrase, partial [Planctomycetes bacterium]|nr:tyrosine-type recombinase/integrase [Planctomycetota bacterium]
EFKKWLLKAKENASTPHINKILRNVKTFFNHFRLSEPPVFKNVEKITSELKQYPTDHDLGFHFKVKELKDIVNAALEQDNELCTITREMHVAGKNFDGTMQNKYVPIFPTIILIMLTGMRKNEALSLKWDMVDLENGVIRIERAQKTGKSRIIPLLTDPSGVISDSLVELLKIWKSNAKDEFVLPHPMSKEPSELKKPLEKFKSLNGFPDLNFQNLRKSFVSYAVSFRIPATNIAFWVGHSVAVSERHYMRYALGLEKGNSIKEAMGLSEIHQKALEGYNSKGIYKNLKNTSL